MKGKLITGVHKEDQPYVDDPIAIYPRQMDPIEASVRKALSPKERGPQAIVVGYNRIRLRWVKPAGAPK